MNLIDKKKEIFFIIILLYSLYDRTLWTDITQWQVDQATTMWVGLNFSYRDMPIGLISSLGIPNPNGMMYLSKLLTKFPNLWLSGYILSLLHLFLITLLGFFLSRENKEKFFIIIIPLILCVSLYLRSHD